VGTATTQYLYDGMNAIQEKNGATVNANLLAGAGLDQWFGRTESGASVVYLPDALGSTLALANSSQVIATSYTYEPYGATTATGAASANTLAYAGRENDGTGLYYNRARYYHPGIGRFVSEDPIGLAGGVNLYSYVGGNPIGYRDSSGHVSELEPVLAEIFDLSHLGGVWSAGAAAALAGGYAFGTGLNDLCNDCLGSAVADAAEGFSNPTNNKLPYSPPASPAPSTPAPEIPGDRPGTFPWSPGYPKKPPCK
jgi:RHS repeat-associated protein